MAVRRKIAGVVANIVVRSPWWTPSQRARILRGFGSNVGRNVRVYPFVTFVNYVDEITIDDDVFLNVNITFGSNAPVHIESGVSVGPGTAFLPTSHSVGGANRRAGAAIASPIRVQSGVWIGANVTVLGGVTIGAGSIVAAGSVVTKDVPENVLTAGVPARVVRQLEEAAEEQPSA